MTAIVFTLLGIGVVIHEVLRSRRATFDFLCFFNVSFLIYFVLAPLHLLLGGASFAGLPNIYQDYFEDQQLSRAVLLSSGLVIAASYVLVLFGFHRLQGASGPRLTIEPFEPRRLAAAVAICGAVGALALALYSVQFPDWKSAFVKAVLIRSGAEKSEGSLVFLRNLAPLLAATSILVFAAWLDRTRGVNSGRLGLLLALMIVFSMLAVLAQGSRRAWLIYALEFYLVAANYRKKTYFTWGAALMVVALAVISLGDLLAFALASGAGLGSGLDVISALGDAGVLYAAVWRDFTLPYLESLAVIDRYEAMPRLFLDVPYAFLQLIPERLLPLELPAPLADETTLLITGIPVSAIAEVPPALIGFFWMSGYLPGVLIGSLAYGWFGRAAENFLADAARRQAAVMVLFTWCGFGWAYFMREGVPSMLVTERFHWFVAGSILLAVSTVRIEGRGEGRCESCA